MDKEQLLKKIYDKCWDERGSGEEHDLLISYEMIKEIIEELN